MRSILGTLLIYVRGGKSEPATRFSRYRPYSPLDGIDEVLGQAKRRPSVHLSAGGLADPGAILQRQRACLVRIDDRGRRYGSDKEISTAGHAGGRPEIFQARCSRGAIEYRAARQNRPEVRKP